MLTRFHDMIITLWNSECEEGEECFSFDALPDDLRFDVNCIQEYCQTLGGILASRQVAAMVFHNYKVKQ